MRRRRRGPDGSPGAVHWDGQVWRRWSGDRWVVASYSLRPGRLREATPFAGQEHELLEVRRRALALAVEDQASVRGAVLLHDGPSGTVLGYQRAVSHGLHAVATLLTGGLWAVVWIACALDRTQDRVRLEVDHWGNVWPVRLRSA